jgi:hypothetical protein
MSLLVRRPGRPPLMMVGDLTYDARLLQIGHVRGVGSRHRRWQSVTRLRSDRPASLGR